MRKKKKKKRRRRRDPTRISDLPFEVLSDILMFLNYERIIGWWKTSKQFFMAMSLVRNRLKNNVQDMDNTDPRKLTQILAASQRTIPDRNKDYVFHSNNCLYCFQFRDFKTEYKGKTKEKCSRCGRNRCYCFLIKCNLCESRFCLSCSKTRKDTSKGPLRMVKCDSCKKKVCVNCYEKCSLINVCKRCAGFDV